MTGKPAAAVSWIVAITIILCLVTSRLKHPTIQGLRLLEIASWSRVPLPPSQTESTSFYHHLFEDLQLTPALTIATMTVCDSTLLPLWLSVKLSWLNPVLLTHLDPTLGRGLQMVIFNYVRFS
ncbi:hypothetical protein BDV12DRAFT_18583 [Aspergillus spectabilis]